MVASLFLFHNQRSTLPNDATKGVSDQKCPGRIINGDSIGTPIGCARGKNAAMKTEDFTDSFRGGER